MMHPDHIYTVRQLQYQDLLAEAERERVKREFAGNQRTSIRSWLAAWSRRLSARGTHGATLTDRAG